MRRNSFILVLISLKTGKKWTRQIEKNSKQKRKKEQGEVVGRIEKSERDTRIGDRTKKPYYPLS